MIRLAERFFEATNLAAPTRSVGRPSRARRRPGISLLEVLISMFVALVGVLSIFSLIALGRYEILEASKADRALAIGRSGLREMQTRGFLESDNINFARWVDAGLSFQVTGNQYGALLDYTAGQNSFGVHGIGVDISPQFTIFDLASANLTTLGYTAPGYLQTFAIGYAIDPLGVAANSNVTANGMPIAELFPPYYANGTTAAAMTLPTQGGTFQLALGSGPQPLARNSLAFGPTTLNNQSIVAGQSMASGLFQVSDDIVSFPTQASFAPMQVFSQPPGSTQPPVLATLPGRRRASGDFSWLATVVPTRNSSRQCLVSIVVFYKRNLQLPATLLSNVAPPERMVNVTFPSLQSSVSPPTLTPDNTTINVQGGGDVVLSCPSSVTSDYIKVRPNQWILLTQPMIISTANGTPGMILAPPTWRWYRVVATSDPVQGFDSNSNSIWMRKVTLAGPDWNPNRQIPDPNNSGTPIPTWPTSTYATILDGVVGVYEREMNLEVSGNPWSAD